MLTGLYARLIGVALIIAAIAGGYFYVSHLRSEIAALNTQNTVLNTQLATQNTAVEALKKEGDARLAMAQTELSVAKAAAGKYQGSAKVVYKMTPSIPGNDCKSALVLLNGVSK